MKCPSCGVANIDGSDECDGCGGSLAHAERPKKGLEKKILEGVVSDIAPRQALTIAAGQSVSEGLDSMRRNKVGCLLVVDGGNLVGVVSERELLTRLPDALTPGKTPVAEVMRADTAVMHEDDPVADVFHQMAVSGYRHLAVRLNDGRLAVLSSRDLLRYLCK